MIYLFFFLTITSFVYAFILLHQERKQKVLRRLSLITDSEVIVPTVEEPDNQEPAAWKRGLANMWRRIKRYFERKMTEEQELKLEMKLLRAGSPFGMGPFEFRILQIILLLALPAIAVAYSIMLRAGVGGILLAILIGIGLALLLPSYYLVMKTKQRSKMALRELPDVLDLLTVSLEAGLGFDAAMSKLVSKSNGVLSTEFHRCLEEIRLGKTRREALIGVKERVVLDEIKVVISSILQAEKLGIGMVQVLRVQSREVREQRKQRAEEEAMKAPIKMLFPLILFIFPSLFIVLLGPAVLQFIAAFSK